MAICREDICHRESDFDQLLQNIEKKLLQLFEIKNTKKYRAVVITGSGTAANESILSSVVGNKNILILSNGEFGERLFHTSKIHNKNTFLLEFPWGQKLDFSIIENFLQENKIDVIAMVHHETSSGMLNCLEKIGILAKTYQAMLIVDCVSSSGAEVIDLEKHNISFCSSSSSKAIGSYSGISFVVGDTQEFEKLAKIPAKTTYLSLYKLYHFINTVSQTPNTPAVPLFYALEQALLNILTEGVSKRHENILGRASLLRNGMKKIGLFFVLEEDQMSSVLTTVWMPEHMEVTTLQGELRKKNIIIYAGKGIFKNKVFQVGNIGELSVSDIKFFLRSLETALKIPQVKKLT